MQTLLPLSAGPLEMLLDPATGHLRRVSLGRDELVRGVYAAIRADDWSTIPPTIAEPRIERGDREFTVRFDAEHRDDQRGVAFQWSGVVRGRSTGVVTYDLVGRALAPFRSNRVGFCVLHPASCAGQAFRVTAPDGSEKRGVFPELVTHDLPMTNVRAVRRAVPGMGGAFVEVVCEGEVFETEDQRNWSDASYKTYVRPSSLPRPFEVPADAEFRQRVTITPEGLRERDERRLRSAPSHARPRDVEAALSVGGEIAATPLRLATAEDARTRQFSDLNGARPAADSDRISFALHPQIHQTDDLTIAESFATHGVLVETIRSYAPEARVVAGPIRFAPPGVDDPRAGGGLHAAWLLASLARVSAAGAAEVVWDGAGWADRSDSPAATLFASLQAEPPAAAWRRVESSRPDEVVALAIGSMLFVANCWYEPRRVTPPADWGDPFELAPYSVATLPARAAAE